MTRLSGGDWKALFAAASEGDVELVRFYAAQGVDVDYQHPEYQSTPLVACLLAGQEASAHALLDLGADPSLYSDFDEMTPLEAARAMRIESVVVRLGGAPTGTGSGRPSMVARLLDRFRPAPRP